MTVYKCIYDTKDIHIGERRLLSIMSQNYEIFRKLQIKICILLCKNFAAGSTGKCKISDLFEELSLLV